MNPLSLIMGGGQVLGGLISGLIGGSQRRQGKRILKNNPYPAYEIPQEAVQAASEGLPSEQYTQAMKNLQRQQTAAITAAQDRRSGLAAIAKTQALTNDAVGSLDVANAQARQMNQQRLAQYREKAWDWNKRQKYLETRAYGMGLLGAGNQNIVSGIDKGIAGLGYIGYGLFGDKNGSKSNGGGGVMGGGGSDTYWNNPMNDI